MVSVPLPGADGDAGDFAEEILRAIDVRAGGWNYGWIFVCG